MRQEAIDGSQDLPVEGSAISRLYRDRAPQLPARPIGHAADALARRRGKTPYSEMPVFGGPRCKNCAIGYRQRRVSNFLFGRWVRVLMFASGPRSHVIPAAG